MTSARLPDGQQRGSLLGRFRRSAPSPHPATHPDRSDGPPTVLVVDDVEAIRVLVRTTLEPEFVVVGEASDGAQAVLRAEELQPDVVLLDLNMPRHDGLEAISEIRARCPGTRVVVLSGLAPEVIADKALELGADRFVDKSAPLEELRDVLLDALEG